jgi:galactitol-specific phosphotransferase system IIB component
VTGEGRLTSTVVDHAVDVVLARQSNTYCMINTDVGRISRRNDEDAAAVVAVLTTLAAASAADEPETAPRSVWADPAHRLGLRPASASGWWASGLPR